MSFKAKVIVFLRYGLAMGSGLIFQFYLLKTFSFFKDHAQRKTILWGFTLGNALLLIIPVDLVFNLTLPVPLYVSLAITALSYQILSAGFLIFYHLGRFRLFAWNRVRGELNPRRRLLFAGTLTAMGALPFVRSLVNGLSLPRVTRVKLSVPNAPASGLRILHITDMHSGYFFGPRQIQHIRKKARELRPDLIVFTGDQLHNTHAPFLAMLQRNLAPISAPLGVFQVAGNHDHRLGKHKLFSALLTIGVQPLNDEAITLVKDGTPFELIGIDDLNYGGSLDRAMAHVGTAPCKILLSHRPRVVTKAALYNISLVLAGHTHGGQLCAGPVCPSLLETPYTYGLYRHADTWLYVSSGAGVTGPPMRLFSDSELALIEISRGAMGT